MMHGRRPTAPGGKLQLPDKETVFRLLSYLKPYIWHLILVVILIVAGALANVQGSLFLKTLIDGYIAPLLLQGEAPDFTPLLHEILKMGVIYLIGVLSTLFYARIMASVAQGVLKTIRDDMFAHMQHLPIRYFDTHPVGDTMSHYTNDADTLRQLISQSLPQVFSTVITITAVFIAMCVLSLPLTLFALISVALIVFFSAVIGKKSAIFFTRQQKSLGILNGYIEEMMNGQKVVKVFNHENAVKKEFDEKNNALCYDMTQANTFSNILPPIMNNLGQLQYAMIAVFGGWLVISGTGSLLLGDVAAFLQLSQNFARPISQVSQQVNLVIMAMAGAKRIFTLIDEPIEEDHGYVTLVNAQVVDGQITESEKPTGMWAWRHPHGDGTLTYTPLRGDVRMFDVDFGYTPEKTVLHDITLYAEPGQKVAFVGATGAGKTTITNLINRFYDIADGKIRYDGININKIKKPDLRRSLGVVLQDVNLFTGTVLDNIRYGKLDATDEECIEAAKLANADGFIRMLPQGYNTVLDGSGEGLSQGQRQLISIARAAVANPPVMILDEATSSIDTRTEALVQKGMDGLMQGRTVFVIAHRLSTVQNADVIMVLDNGRIIERGNHEKLIAEKGQYYKLYTGAFELE